MGLATDQAAKGEEDLYMRLKDLQRQMEFLDIQEEYIKDEMKNLKREMIRAQEEIKRVQSVPLVIGQFSEMIDQNRGIVSSTTGSNYFVRILSTLNRELLKPSSSVALHRHSHAVVDILPPEADSTVQSLAMSEKPDVTYADIGGMDIQKQEIKEAVELPLTHKELYAQIGIDPPSGVLLYGPPGTGKTLLARAMAHNMTSNFLKVVASAIVDKYIGESARIIREMFGYAKEHQPCIIFMDEVDAIGGKRFSQGTSADREIQRTLMELLNQLDGFDDLGRVKIIMATNRPDTLDPALLRPGRLDRKVEIPLPNEQSRVEILKIHSDKITKHGDIDWEAIVKLTDSFNGADMRNICTEAGMFAIRAERDYVVEEDFMKAARKIADNKKLEGKLDYEKV
mmetsp:Transcript_6487/g.20069  ORF Transcript_6487/g.20069 Transcript_6487/m.20069 type:complete len:397 (+) Transcript_6487:100-1290(+)